MPLLTRNTISTASRRSQRIFLSGMASIALFLDVDNALTGANGQEIKPEVMDWLERSGRPGCAFLSFLIITSCGSHPFANRLGLGYIADAAKPKKKGGPGQDEGVWCQPAADRPHRDQLFTDILCGNLCGCVTILVEPYAEEGYGLYRIKRPLEKPLLRLYHRRKKECQ